ncbi:hypothetical protein SLEP1_g5815 [Rubroshorea leprosula]|uniref:PRONE domain-containing protein n=1 Tax=Rubroshorea leprosula TaxID=152421 RepID=A0AAV5I3T2_9ROSI|nr:hypothetical protein SLEP1_g5815 [Rubroshorea leprosula]
MENSVKKQDGFEFCNDIESVSELSTSESRQSSSSESCLGTFTEKVKTIGSSSPPLFVRPTKSATVSKSSVLSDVNGDEDMTESEDSRFKKLGAKVSEIEMMKERFAKLLLGEDMSGSGKGVCTALAISNAITNLCASIFGQLWRLEPIPDGKKSIWRREMELLLCVCDNIVELIPSWQTFPDGSKLEYLLFFLQVMACRPRSDIFINLPALHKLDNMLLEILDSFTNTEFWYVDQGIVAPEADGSASFQRIIQRQGEKWWLPVPRVPPGGLSEDSRKQLNHTRECTNQILKAAMAINSITLSEMEVPDSYLEALPKNGRACLGDIIYRYITSDQFSAECLLDFLDLSSEHMAIEIANRVEASIYVWRRRAHSKLPINPNRSAAKSSWEMVKDLVVDGDKREFLAERAESLLLCLKQRFPGLSQSTLDTSKIQCNKDVGKSILESYSRVLESLAYNVVARIDDLLYVDDLSKHSDKLSLSVPSVSVIAHKKVTIPYSVPVLSTPYITASTTPCFSPALLLSPTRREVTPFLKENNNNKPHRRGFGVRRVLTNYLGVESKARISGNPADGSCSIPNNNTTESSAHQEEQNASKQSSSQQNGS